MAKRNSRAIRSLVQDDKWPWPDVRLESDSVLEWNTSEGGGVRAIGYGGVVTGFRAEMVLVDDIQSDAGSDVTREGLSEWFRTVLSTRLEPSGIVCLIQTRWHDSDIIGQLAEGESADQWTFVNLPAIANENDVLARAEGSALWPARWPLEKLAEKKLEVGSISFGAQYQGDPVPSDGRMFRPEWFEHRFDVLPTRRVTPPPVARRMSESERMQYIGTRFGNRAFEHLDCITIQSCDSAWKDGVTNDRSAVATLVSDYKDIYVTDLWFGRVQYPELRRVVESLYHKHRPRVLYVEEASSGYALVQELKATTGIPIVGVTPGRDSKEARAESVSGLFEAGRIKLPRSASWVEELLKEFLRFPHGRHDDIVDAVVLGISQMDETIRRQQATEQRAERNHKLRDFMAR